jgi:hypothetical protein
MFRKEALLHNFHAFFLQIANNHSKVDKLESYRYVCLMELLHTWMF